MSLTKNQRTLIQGLKILGFEKEDVVAIMLLMETDEMADTLLDWIVENNREEKLTYGRIQRKALALNKQLSRK